MTSTMTPTADRRPTAARRPPPGTPSSPGSAARLQQLLAFASLIVILVFFSIASPYFFTPATSSAS